MDQPPAVQPAPQDQAQRETTCEAVLRARERAAAARAQVEPPKGRTLRIMQKKELAQKMAESKVIEKSEVNPWLLIRDS